MSSTSNSRVQPGVPTGGQFAARRRSESAVQLSESDMAYNQDGTYEFPPHPRNIRQVADFWSSVHVPDQILRQMQRSYNADQDQWRVEQLNVWKRDNPMPPQTKFGGRANPEYDQWVLDLTIEDDKLQAVHRPDIPPSLARPLARAAGMYHQAVFLDQHTPDAGALESFWQHEVDLGMTGEATMANLLDAYPVHQLERETWIDRSAEASLDAAYRLQQLVDRR